MEGLGLGFTYIGTVAHLLFLFPILGVVHFILSSNVIFHFYKEKTYIYFRKSSPAPESVVLHVDHLSRNVNEAHLKEIFGEFVSLFHVI